MKRDQDPLENAVFFVDRCLGKKCVASALRETGHRAEVHDDHFPQDAKDEEWLPVVGERGWLVITRDDRIRYHSLEAAAAPASGCSSWSRRTSRAPRQPRSS